VQSLHAWNGQRTLNIERSRGALRRSMFDVGCSMFIFRRDYEAVIEARKTKRAGFRLPPFVELFLR